MPQAAGQVKILILLVKIKKIPYVPIIFMMQDKCLFLDISRPGIVSDIECFHKIIFTLGSVLQSLWKNVVFSKNFTALQFSKSTKGLYNMDENSIKSFLTN